ncbi:hypothetical protein Cgig2_012711 [Carnegiea gigantea]|uniref:Uncharacterized protein n=1 Tax=Carnegiea gigantea TaxID=171969 RepID=A0A9Q1Q4K5_9CARY|nr:hypothetical protein Cgig2_012711 [Carnegiea gigantea]
MKRFCHPPRVTDILFPVAIWSPPSATLVMPMISKVKNVLNQDFSSPYKQALLSNPNGNGLEGQKSPHEAMEEGVHENLLDNSKTINRPLDNAHNCPIYVGKFPSQVPSYGSSVEDDEEIDNSLRPFDNPVEMELQLHKKSETCRLSSKGKKRGNKNSKPTQNSPTPTKIAKEAFDFGKRLGVFVICDETPAIRRITRNLRKKSGSKRG